MQPGALIDLATSFELRAPGFAFLLRDWARVLPDEPEIIATAMHDALVAAHHLASHAPHDAVHRDVIEALSSQCPLRNP